ncbi:MAG: hypothetical protein P1U89_16045 [Verrucomicrobiales bacterium]|nr:hypothetical protein [Verrucomicrobiales bacterium]
MEFVFLICVVAAVCVAIFIKNRQIAEKWEGAGHELGLTYFNTGKPQLTGRFENRTVKVKVYSVGHGKGGQLYTGFEVEYHQMFHADFQLTRQGFLENVVALVGGQDIETGHTDFDSVVVVKGRDEEAVKRFFRSKRARNTCLNLFRKSRYSKVQITNRKISASLPGNQLSTYEIRSTLNYLLGIVSVLEETEAQLRSDSAKTLPPPLPLRKEKPTVPEEVTVLPSGPEREVATFVEPELSLTEWEDSVEIIPDEVAENQAPGPVALTNHSGISVREVADQIFESKQGKYQSIKCFEDWFHGEDVLWQGELSALVPASTDRNFSRDSGWIAVCDFGKFPGMESGVGTLQVKYRIGAERAEKIKHSGSQKVEIEGRLLKFDPFTNTLYVDSEDPIGSPEAYSKNPVSFVTYAERMKKEVQSRPGEVRRFS